MRFCKGSGSTPFLLSIIPLIDAVLSSPDNSPGDDFYNRTKTKKLKVLINTGLSASFQQGMRESNAMEFSQFPLKSVFLRHSVDYIELLFDYIHRKVSRSALVSFYLSTASNIFSTVDFLRLFLPVTTLPTEFICLHNALLADSNQ